MKAKHFGSQVAEEDKRSLYFEYTCSPQTLFLGLCLLPKPCIPYSRHSLLPLQRIQESFTGVVEGQSSFIQPPSPPFTSTSRGNDTINSGAFRVFYSANQIDSWKSPLLGQTLVFLESAYLFFYNSFICFPVFKIVLLLSLCSPCFYMFMPQKRKTKQNPFL